ncbi:MAG: ribonuclease HII [Ruminiclostridium sp.]|nr:ribonuclease HII [Ruminiclostridium sp.]
MKDNARLLMKQEKEKIALEAEYMRYRNMCIFEETAYGEGVKIIGGIDEAGRGPLAGPVVAACVILSRDTFIKGLNDSKKLTVAKRDIIYDEILEKAVALSTGVVDEKCIDEINILNATKKAMKSAIASIKPVPELLLIDAVKLSDVPVRQIPIIKGDTLSVSIAAASIIAKVTRDRMIDELDSLYPQYGFKQHKGYGTEEHIKAIKKFGICPIHRISFTKNFI